MKIFCVQLMFLAGIVLSRLLPHPPDLTPAIAFAVLSAGIARYGLLTVWAAFLVSDGLLALMYAYPVFGVFSFFTYSAMGCIVLTAQFFRCFNLFFGLSASLFYWLWTNFGVWVTGSFYSHSMAGLTACYTAALPFLAYSLVGTGIGYALYFVVYTPFFKGGSLRSRRGI